jgi:four helix bundle suffix protein
MMGEKLIPTHGGYRKLKSFQVAEVVYDLTARFCETYVDRFSRTRDQMVQAARSGRQNIAEGSMASATSKKTELKLTSVAKASLEELLLDYEDFLRQRRLPQWERRDPRRQALVDLRPGCADDVAEWAVRVHRGEWGGLGGRCGQRGPGGQRSAPVASPATGESTPSTQSTMSTAPDYPEIAANGALALTAVAIALLDRQMQTLAATFQNEGGFAERLYRVRSAHRRETNGRG